jgi:solute carrier family 66 (lysosomal lysine-arginine transporter), member 1
MGLLLGTCLLHILIGNTHREMPSGTVIPVGRRLLVFVVSLQFPSSQPCALSC